tara:strand:- start:278 stop:607 length:330 start_codon:yes stop_codon:yes gene_type:complete
MENEFDDETITLEEYLKNLKLEDFLNNTDTREILEQECYYDFEKFLKPKLIALFEKYANRYSCKDFLKNDLDGTKNSDIFSEMVYDNILRNYDKTIFQDCPSLAKSLLK